MEGINYRFPFNPSALMTENGSIETCDIAESIAQNIMLLIITKKEKTGTTKTMETMYGM